MKKKKKKKNLKIMKIYWLSNSLFLIPRKKVQGYRSFL